MADTIVNDDVKKYELMVIINPDLGGDAVKKRLDETRKLLAQKKGETEGQVYFEDVWGLRDLTYNIKKHDKGYYAVFDFMTDPQLIAEIDNTLRLEPELLRHMIVSLPFSYEAKTLAKMNEEAAAAEALIEKPVKKGPYGAPAIAPAPVKRSVLKNEEPVAKAAAATEAIPETAPKKAAKKEEKKETTLEEVDAKLKSIIDNPDINF